MAITRGIKTKLDKYGINLPVDKRTRAYREILQKNKWTENQYDQYLKQYTKRFEKKEKAISKQVQQTNFRQRVMADVIEQNKVRHIGSVLLQFLITKDRFNGASGISMKDSTESIRVFHLSCCAHYIFVCNYTEY